MQSLFIFQKCRITISSISQFAYDELRSEYEQKQNTPLMISIINMILLETSVFFEEYHNCFNSRDQNLNNRIRVIKDICKPITREINRWKDLKNYRNEIVAHPWRNKKGEFVLPGSNHYKIPRTWVDIFTLGLYIQYIHDLIYAEFKIEHQKSLEKYYNHENEIIPQVTSLETYNELNENMVNLVNKACEENNKSYRLRIRLYKNE